jgi:hypothetical protein
MTFRIASNGGDCANCRWIAADGEIQRDTATSLQLFLKDHKDHPPLLVINSLGGESSGGIELGKTIRSENLDVYVGQTTDVESSRGNGPKTQRYAGGDCASACVFALMGGVHRGVADDKSTVRIHQFRPAEKGESSKASTNALKTSAGLDGYALWAGVAPKLVGWILSVPQETTETLSLAQMEETNLLTSRSSPTVAAAQKCALGRSAVQSNLGAVSIPDASDNGVGADEWLAAMGITPLDIDPTGARLVIRRSASFYGGYSFRSDVNPNVMTLELPHLSASSFVLEFQRPVSDFSFTIPGLYAGPNGIIFPAFSATAFPDRKSLESSDYSTMARVDEPLLQGPPGYRDTAARTYTLQAKDHRGIGLVLFKSDPEGVAAFQSIVIEQFGFHCIP